MIYTFLKKLITASLVVFYRSIVVEGKENIPRKGPLIIAANHPNTFMDPLLIAAFVKQRVGFLANGGIFKNKIMAAVLNYLHVIPIFRKKDIREGEVQDNSKYFSKTVDYLDKKGTFMIFPEGSSFYEQKLREIKTGTARIAFQFQEEHAFKDDLKIMTVALNYSDAIKFRSKVMITFNKPISVDEYKSEFENDSQTAVRSLTAKIEEELAEQLVIAPTSEQEELLRQIQKIYAEYWTGDKRLKSKDKTEMEVRIALSRAISFFHDQRPEKYQQIKSKVSDYFRRLEAINLSNSFISNRYFSNTAVLYLLHLGALILGLPIFAIGFFTHLVPVNISIQLSKIPNDIEYKAPVLMGVATILIPIFYFLEIWIFNHYTGLTWLTILFGLSLPLCGGFVILYRTLWQRYLKIRFYIGLKRKHSDFLERMKVDRVDILELLESARTEYNNRS